jgi:hypothetical protein
MNLLLHRRARFSHKKGACYHPPRHPVHGLRPHPVVPPFSGCCLEPMDTTSASLASCWKSFRVMPYVLALGSSMTQRSMMYSSADLSLLFVTFWYFRKAQRGKALSSNLNLSSFSSGAIPEGSMREPEKPVKNLTRIRQVSAALNFRGGPPIFRRGPTVPVASPVNAVWRSPPPLRLDDGEALVQAACQRGAEHTITWEHVSYVALLQIRSQLLESRDLAGDRKSSADRISAKPRQLESATAHHACQRTRTAAKSFDAGEGVQSTSSLRSPRNRRTASRISAASDLRS